MLSMGIIDGEGEFTADGNKAARDVRTRDGARVPRIKEKENSFIGNPHRFSFVAHDFEAFCQVAVDSFHEHWVVV